MQKKNNKKNTEATVNTTHDFQMTQSQNVAHILDCERQLQAYVL